MKSAWGQTRTSADVCHTTASPPNADMKALPREVAKVPNPDIAGLEATGAKDCERFALWRKGCRDRRSRGYSIIGLYWNAFSIARSTTSEIGPSSRPVLVG